MMPTTGPNRELCARAADPHSTNAKNLRIIRNSIRLDEMSSIEVFLIKKRADNGQNTGSSQEFQRFQDAASLDDIRTVSCFDTEPSPVALLTTKLVYLSALRAVFREILSTGR